MTRTSIEPLQTVSSLELVQQTSSVVSAQHDGVETAVDLAPADVAPEPINFSQAKSILIIGTVSSMVLVSTILTGMLTVALPTIAKDLALRDDLMLWPASVYALACGCTLILSGAVADVIGTRSMYLVGCGILVAFTIGCALAQTGIQLVVFRALSGVAVSFFLPSSVSIITASFPTGKRRNAAFACLGAAQPVGFSLGLVLGGFLIGNIGWRGGFYIIAGSNFLIVTAAIKGLPSDPRKIAPVSLHRLWTEIDWVGACLASTSLGLLSYVFTTVTSGTSRFVHPVNITLLAISIVLVPAFYTWIERQERLLRPAIIPNSFWRTNRVFTVTCVAVFFSWATFQAVQYFMTLYLQIVQGLNPVQTSIRFLPMVISSTVANVVTGLLVHKIKANTLVVVSSILSTFPGLVMAFVKPSWSYWTAPFIALLMVPIAADTLFTISNLVITAVFPEKAQALAGGVFNTVAMVGNSVGLAVCAVLASEVTKRSAGTAESAVRDVLAGYHAVFWLCFAANVFVVGITVWGLRRIGRVGLKRE